MLLTKWGSSHPLSKPWFPLYCSHPNIIAYKEAFFDESWNTLNIVMEFADEGDLEDQIKKKRKECSYFAENEIWNIFIQALRGLACLHESQILHRDLKVTKKF